MYQILIAGAGYVGLHAAEYFSQKKQRVTVIKRTDRNEDKLCSLGVNILKLDLSQPGSIPKVPEAHFVLIALAPDERTDDAYRKIYLDAVSNLLAGIAKNPRPLLVLYLSSTGVYAANQQGPIDEDTIPEPSTERGKILLKAEQQVLQAPFPSAVFRLSGIYGPDRNRISMFQTQAWPPQHPEKYMNMIHRDDIVDASLILLKRAKPGKVYLGVDDEPVLESEFYAWLSKELKTPFPDSILTRENHKGKRYTNTALKATGFTFKYPNFRAGYQELLNPK